MDLRQRLARLDGCAADTAGLVARSDASLLELGLSAAETPAGTVWFRETTSRVRRPRPLAALRRVLPGFPAAPPEVGDLLFLDTETTGLSGGTGTLAFLVGLGWWEARRFRTRQLFLASPGGERALLHDLAATLERFRTLVTFNGNGFDLPLLRTRAILARRRGLFDAQDSLDLLPVARRLWGRRLPDCRQQTVEQDQGWGERGPADIPGALIPQAWLSFVRTGRRGPLVSVLEHNRWDLEGMAVILAAAARRAAVEPDHPGLPWQDAWSLARLAEADGDAERAFAWLDAALTRVDAAPPRFYVDAVRLLKRRAEDRRVAALLEQYRLAHAPDRWYHYEAAVLKEHRLADLTGALAHARALGDGLREARLERKLAAAP